LSCWKGTLQSRCGLIKPALDSLGQSAHRPQFRRGVREVRWDQSATAKPGSLDSLSIQRQGIAGSQPAARPCTPRFLLVPTSPSCGQKRECRPEAPPTGWNAPRAAKPKSGLRLADLPSEPPGTGLLSVLFCFPLNSLPGQ
jgi:hypothetical protein